MPASRDPGHYWESLVAPNCWNTDFGNVKGYSEHYNFIAGSTGKRLAVLIYKTANGRVRTVQLRAWATVHGSRRFMHRSSVSAVTTRPTPPWH
jgi:hypothetical protein